MIKLLENLEKEGSNTDHVHIIDTDISINRGYQVDYALLT